MSAKASQSFKSYQKELYETIKSGCHIICLGPEQTKTYLFLLIIKNRALELHQKSRDDSKQVFTLVFEPNAQLAACRYKLLTNHTELSIVNLFDPGRQISPEHQVVICPLSKLEFSKNSNVTMNSIVFDHADTILRNDGTDTIHRIVRQFESIPVLAFMCSLIDVTKYIPHEQIMTFIKKLEAVFDARCEISDLRSMTSNINIIECTQAEFESEKLLLADDLLKDFCHFITDLKLKISDKNPHIISSSSINEQLVLVQSCLSDIIYARLHLGLWCTKKITYLHLIEFYRILSLSPSNDVISAAVSILSCTYGLHEDLIDHTDVDSSKNSIQQPLLSGLSVQLKELLDLLNHDRTRSCLIHVKRPVIAKVIAHWLDELSRMEEYSFINANYIDRVPKRDRNTYIKKLKTGNCGVLVSAARGLDVPRCDLVISFDLPKNFADFAHAKATCRTDASKYVLIVDSVFGHDAKEKLLKLSSMERLLSNNSLNKVMDIEADAEETKLIEHMQDKYPPYPSSSQTPATLWRSIGIVNKYCSKLPSDSFTKLSPEWNPKTHTDTAEYYYEVRLPINSPVRQTIVGPPSKLRSLAQRLAAYTVCKLLHNTNELDDDMLPITKECMKSISREFQKGGIYAGHKRGRRAQAIGSTRHRQYYQKRIAKVFCGPPPSPHIRTYLYKFNMALINPIPDEQNRRGRRIVDPKETNRNYAIVCSQRIPKICPFPLFTRSGEVRISLELVDDNIILSDDQVDNMKLFHKFTFSKVLRLEKYPIKFDPDKSPFAVLLAPVIEESAVTRIDWNFIDKIVNSDKSASTPSVEDCKQFNFNYDDYADAVVIPWYRITDCQEFAYYVAHICTDLNPNSSFPDIDTGYPSFIDYYKGKYGITVYHKDQPILDVDHTSARLNLLTPRYVNRKGITLPSSTAKTRRESRESLAQKQLLIPELCSIHPFPASFWRKAVCLPCIFHRLNSLLLAEELRRTVTSSTGVGFVEPPDNFEWEPLDFGWSISDAINQTDVVDMDVIRPIPTFGELLPGRESLSQELDILPNEAWKDIKFDPTLNELDTIGPSPSIILQALTMSNASDGINLERLETVGDSFLKYSITAYLYCNHPTLHEGKLSYLRSIEISNINLYNLGRSRNLGELMSATKFEPNDNWLAPGYFEDNSPDAFSKKEIDKALAEVPYDLLLQHSIPDKSIADCVEALIGAYLTTSGSRAALLFMQWLGLEIIPESMQLRTVKPPSQEESLRMWRWLELPLSPLITLPPAGDTGVVNASDAQTAAACELDRHYFGGQLDEFERFIGYSFRDKAYIVQAFSHNSYYENHVTNCYQRLEFLGDAILDYVITRYLFEDPRCHSPGTLTDLRSALVNNSFFASLAVKYNFHKFLKYFSDELFYVIDGFVRKFQTDSNMTTISYKLLITEGESDHNEDIEVPKALGDVFESVAGAIYLDSGMSLDKVWDVYFRMMKPEIEYFSIHVPKSPIRELLESMPQNVRFSQSELTPDRQHRVIAEVFGLGCFIGVGRSKHSAKSTAAKRALRALKSR